MEQLYEVREIKNGLWYINEGQLDAMYIVQGSKRGLVIDTGTGVGDFKKLIESFLVTPYDVVLTHGHVDHAGGAGQFKRVYLHEGDLQMVQDITLSDREQYVRQMYEVNASTVTVSGIVSVQKQADLPEFICIQEDYIFDLGDKKIKVVECPGHTQGSIMLIDEENRLFFTGDNVNDTELICAPGENRLSVLKKWYDCASSVLEKMKNDEICFGGHNMFTVSQAEDTLTCGYKLMTGEIKTEKTVLHIFRGNFAKYKNAVITIDEKLEMM